jgi:hypothetical protein
VDPDPHHFGNLDPHPNPDPHHFGNLDPHPDPHPHQIKIRIWIRIWICLKVISCIRIRINLPNCR